MTRNKILLFGASLGVLVVLVVSAVQENFMREWRRIQGAGRSDEGPIGVQLRQIVNPTLRVSDRCVSCHVAMGPGEQSVSGGEALVPHKPVVHDPSEYGCTVCHGGQGQATEKADAHGDVHFWPAPMIPARWSQAGCGTCHSHTRIPSQQLFARARGAFERLDCLACHRVDGRGGTIRPTGLGMEGPDLSRSGATGYDTEWYAKHLAKSAAVKDGPWKTLFTPINEADREMLTTYLATRVAAPALIEAKAAFHSSGCLGCHKVSGVGGDDGPDISRAGEKDPGQLDSSRVPEGRSLVGWNAEHFRSPAAVVAGSLMPAQGLSGKQVELLTFYMVSLRRGELPGAYLPKDRVRVSRFSEREFSSDGATVFGAFCSGCHGPEGKGLRAPGMASFPSIANQDVLDLVSDDFLMETVRRGRPGRRMPAWGTSQSGLRPEEIRAAVSHLRQLGGVEHRPDSKPARWVKGDPRVGERLFAASCGGCHGKRGEGGDGPALNNQVLLETATDTFLAETIRRGRRDTDMKGFGEASPVRPTLNQAEIESVVAFLRTWQAAALSSSQQGDKKQ